VQTFKPKVGNEPIKPIVRNRPKTSIKIQQQMLFHFNISTRAAAQTIISQSRRDLKELGRKAQLINPSWLSLPRTSSKIQLSRGVLSVKRRDLRENSRQQ
jgi:hypothetical protein